MNFKKILLSIIFTILLILFVGCSSNNNSNISDEQHMIDAFHTTVMYNNISNYHTVVTESYDKSKRTYSINFKDEDGCAGILEFQDSLDNENYIYFSISKISAEVNGQSFYASITNDSQEKISDVYESFLEVSMYENSNLDEDKDKSNETNDSKEDKEKDIKESSEERYSRLFKDYLSSCGFNAKFVILKDVTENTDDNVFSVKLVSKEKKYKVILTYLITGEIYQEELSLKKASIVNGTDIADVDVSNPVLAEDFIENLKKGKIDDALHN